VPRDALMAGLGRFSANEVGRRAHAQHRGRARSMRKVSAR